MKRIVREGEKHFTTAVFLLTIEEPRRVLLMHHKKLGVWMPPGGHVDPNENPYHGAIREVLEETGLDIQPHVPPPVGFPGRVSSYPLPKYFLEEHVPAYKDDPEHTHLDHVYVFQIPHEAPKLNEEESHGIAWYSLEEALELSLFEDVRMILRDIF